MLAYLRALHGLTCKNGPLYTIGAITFCGIPRFLLPTRDRYWNFGPRAMGCSASKGSKDEVEVYVRNQWRMRSKSDLSPQRLTRIMEAVLDRWKLENIGMKDREAWAMIAMHVKFFERQDRWVQPCLERAFVQSAGPL